MVPIPESTEDYIDHSSSVALHCQLRELLMRQIENGLYRPGEPFPTSREIRERYQVSTNTVEHALHWLAERGLIFRKPGRGTIVTRVPVTEELDGVTGIPEAATAQGVQFENRVLRAEMVNPTEREAEILALRPGEKAFRLDRLLTIQGGEPINAEHGLYTPDLGERFLAEPDLMKGSLYKVIENRFGMLLDKASQTIGAVSADRRNAELLHVSVGAPLVYFDRVTYIVTGRPIQFCRSYLPAARFTLHVWLKRRDGGPPTLLSFGTSSVSAIGADERARSLATAAQPLDIAAPPRSRQ